MIAALAAFFCTVAIALADGYGGADFAPVVLGDGARAATPLLAVALATALLTRVRPCRLRRVALAAAVVAQATLALAGFGWWWVEPHATLEALTGGSGQARWWLAAAGLGGGVALLAATRRCRDARLAAATGVGAITVFLLGGGRVYRAFDHVEAGHRALAATLIAVACMALALAFYRVLREAGTATRRGLFALFVLAALLAPFWSGGPAGSRHAGREAAGSVAPESVLLVVVDTLRADAADRDPSGRPSLMPQLDRIAAAGTRFTQAISPAPWTLPSTLSIVSGWNPHRHRAGRSGPDWRVVAGDPAASYLGPTLRDGGYQVAAFVHNPYLRPFYGFGRGHLLFRPYHGNADDGARLLLGWLADHGRRPFFALLHVMDPHWPYVRPPGAPPPAPCPACDSLSVLAYQPTGPAVRAEVRRRYDAEVSYTDSVLGRLYDRLGQQGLLDRTWLIVTADHGEEFWDHGGFLHGHQLYDELLRVPLVVVPPRSAGGYARGRREPVQVRLEDIAATILDVARADRSLARDGRSLLPLLAAVPSAAAEEEPRPAICGYIKSPTDMRYAVRLPPYKAIFRPDNPFAPVLFGLDKDPGEKTNLFTGKLQPLMLLAMSRILKDLQAIPERADIDVQRQPLASAASGPLDADTARQLHSLGYVQ